MKKEVNFLDSFKNLFHIFKGTEPVIEKPENIESDFNSYQVRSIYSGDEIRSFYKTREQFAKNNSQQQTNILLSYLQNISQNTKSSEEKVKNLVALNPEISKARKIYVASIMSPNDLQEELVKITIDDPTMEEDLKVEVEELLNNFFNKQLDFGTKLSEWIGEYSYEVDAKPIMILPKSNIDRMLEHQKAVDSGKLFTESDHFCFPQKNKKDDIVDSIYQEAWEVFEPKLDSKGKIIDKKKIIKQQCETVYTFIQNHKEYCNITTDIGKVFNAKEIKSQNLKKVSDSLLNDMFNTFLGQNTNILAIKDDVKNGDDQPILLELPAKAVVPIIIPGSKTEHLGYFILMDEWGNPLTIFNDYNTLGDPDERLAKGSSAALFNSTLPIFNNNFFNDPKYKYEVNESIFNIAMKQIFEDKFKKSKNLDLPLSEFEALSKFMFHQMLHKNRTTVLFVPESLIVYYCDSFKDDGTGQSKVGSIDFVLSLRTTLIIAGVMGAIRAAIDKENIEVTIDPKNTNPDATIEMIRNIAIDKKKLNFNSTSPSLITRNIADAAVSVIPKNFKGLDFELTRSKDSVASDYRPASEELLNYLSDMYMSSLDVPPSSLNKLAEDEFAKSVTTNNIIFSNDIRKVQKRLKRLNKKLLSTYLRFSKNNQNQLLDLFRKRKGLNEENKNYKTSDNEIGYIDGNIKDNSDDNKPLYTEDEQKFLMSVINNIEADLPAPNIAVTKSHLEDLQSELEFINLVLENVYNEDSIYTENSAYKDFLKTILANIRAAKFKEILANSTLHNSIEFPKLEDFDLSIIKDKLAVIINKMQGIKNYEESITKALENNSGDSEDQTDSGGDYNDEPPSNEPPENFEF